MNRIELYFEGRRVGDNLVRFAKEQQNKADRELFKNCKGITVELNQGNHETKSL